MKILDRIMGVVLIVMGVIISFGDNTNIYHMVSGMYVIYGIDKLFSNWGN